MKVYRLSTPEEQAQHYKKKILNKLDRLNTKSEKLSYLNHMFIKAITRQESILLEMMEQLRNYN